MINDSSSTNIINNAAQINEILERLQREANDPVAVELRESALNTPEGIRLAEELHSAFQAEIDRIDKQAADFVLDMKAQAGPGEADAQKLAEIRRIFSDTQNMSAEELTAFVRTRSDASVTSAIDSHAVVAQRLLANQGDESKLVSSVKEELNRILNVVSHMTDEDEDHCLAQRRYLQHCSTEGLNAANITQADYTVISYLAYASNFSDDASYLADCGLDGLTVKKYCDKLLAHGVISNEYDREFLQTLSQNERYMNLIVDHSDTVDVGDLNTQIVTLRNESDNHAFIGIQGTQKDLLDWINNTIFAGDDLVAEEKWINNKIYSYLDEYDSFDITGHSQGGREAISAAAFLPEEHWAKLRNVYSLDGPGYRSSFLDKHRDKFNRIEGNITHIYPIGSDVGFLLSFPGGNVINISLNELAGEMSQHYTGLWGFTPDGRAISVEGGSPNLKSQLIRGFTTYACESLSPVQAEYALPVFMRLFADAKNPNLLDFEDIGKNLDNLSFNDAITCIATLYIVATDQILGFKDNILRYAIEYSGICDLIPPEMLDAIGFLYDVYSLITLVEFICSGPFGYIYLAAHLYLALVSYVQKWEREAYLAQNPRLHVNYQCFKTALECLENANAALERADWEADNIWRCCLRKNVDRKETWIEEVLHISYIVNIVKAACDFAESFYKKKYIALIDLGLLRKDPHINKGIDTINRIEASARSIAQSAGVPEEEFAVVPSSLLKKAEEAEELTNNIYTEIEDSQETLQKTGRLWNAEDYNTISTHSNDNFSQMMLDIQKVEEIYIAIADIAKAYQSLQETSVREFQAAAN